MPIYDFECAECGVFEVMRRIAERDEPAVCATCGAAGERIQVGSPMIVTAGDSESADSTGSYGMRHRGGCNCCP